MTSVTIATEIGDIEVDLFDESAPKATQNFIDLAKKGFYDDVIFHRCIPGFVVQGGDGEYGKKSSLNPGRVGTGGPGYKFADEPIVGDYGRGTLAMANAGPNTNGSQFFICIDDLTGRLPEELHDLRPGHEGHRRRRPDRGRTAQCPGPSGRSGRHDLGHRPRGVARAVRTPILRARGGHGG